MAEAIIVDVSKYDQVEAAVLKTELALGPISQVINSAGIAGPNTVIDEYPLEDWHQILDVNLTGSFHMLRAILPGMKKRGYGRIVLIASGKEGNPNARLIQHQKQEGNAGKETSKFNISVNCVTPAAASAFLIFKSIDYMLSKKAIFGR